MSRREPISPRLRWAVFARDGFRCRYCGAAPPEVALVIDHAYPVVAGGPSALDNLVTACERCNQGKGADQLPSLAEQKDYRVAALVACQWLVDEWCDLSGEAVSWMPETWLYLHIITCAPDYHHASELVRYFATQARDVAPGGERAVLEAMRDAAEIWR